jgi:hypothetical protein
VYIGEATSGELCGETRGCVPPVQDREDAPQQHRGSEAEPTSIGVPDGSTPLARADAIGLEERDATAGLDHAMHFLQHRVAVGEQVEKAVTGGALVRRIREGEVAGVAAHEHHCGPGCGNVASGSVDHRCGEIDADHDLARVRTQHLDAGDTRTDPEIEHASARNLRRHFATMSPPDVLGSDGFVDAGAEPEDPRCADAKARAAVARHGPAYTRGTILRIGPSFPRENGR